MEYTLTRNGYWGHFNVRSIPQECTVLKVVMPKSSDEHVKSLNMSCFDEVVNEICSNLKQLKVLDLSACIDLICVSERFSFTSDSLQLICFPDTVKSIYSVSGLPNLKRLIAKNVEKIEYLWDCPSLTTLDISSQCQCYSLNNVGIYSYDFLCAAEFSIRCCRNLRFVKIPNKVTIPNFGFRDCVNLVSVFLPDGCSLGKSIFIGCASLEKVTLPNDLLEIPEEMFSGCCNLKEVCGGKRVKKAGDKSFCACLSLRKLSFLLENIGEHLFESGYDEMYGIVMGSLSPRNSKDKFGVILNCKDTTFVVVPHMGDITDGSIVLVKETSRYSWSISEDNTTIISYLPYVPVVVSEVIKDVGQLKWTSKIEALKKYFWLASSPVIDIDKLYREIEQKVNALDIPHIIESYQTSIDEWEKNNVGKDNDFFYTRDTGSVYTDCYMETLLPSDHTSYHDRAYSSNWPLTSEEERETIEKRDAKRRKTASEEYDRDKHIAYLINDYYAKKIEDGIWVESYLHLKQAKEEFKFFCSVNYKSWKFEESLAMLCSISPIRDLPRPKEPMGFF